MANPLLTINQPRDVDLGQDGTIRLVTPYVPLRTGALANSAKTHTVLGSGEIRHVTPYAGAQYYRLPLGRGVREDGRGPHWGERCINDHRTEFISFVKAH